MSPNSIHIDLEDNEEVANMFSGCKAGQTVTMTGEFTISEYSDDRLTATLDSLEDVVKDADDDEPEELTEDYGDEDMEEVDDVMAVIRA